MRYRYFLILAVLLPLSCADKQVASRPETGELSWPEITMQSKPWTRWWWPASAVQESDISACLDDYAEAGLGGLELTTIYGAKGWEDRYRDYLSEDWMKLLQFTLDEAAERNLGIDLANASGWPFGGPWVTPDYACRYLAHKEFRLSGGQTLEEKVRYVEDPMVRTDCHNKTSIENLDYPIATNDSLQYYAFMQVRYPVELPLIAVTANSDTGGYVDLTDSVDADGNLRWVAPEGDWTICALFLGWHGKLVERAGPGGEGDVIDHFDAEATSRYLARFDEAFKGYDLSHLRYFFNDSYEVDDAVGCSDWTGDFFREFLTRRGYDLKPHVAELLSLTGDKETQDRVLFDYRLTISELLLEKYTGIWHNWAVGQGKGIRNQCHGSPANVLDLYAVSDVPETEGTDIIGMKTASSAAHILGKPLTSSESCTWLNEHFRTTLGDVKTAVDRYFLSGVNHIFYHGTCLSPKDAPWPGWLFYAAAHFQPTNSFWTDFGAFNRYVAHCQTFLQSGRPDNDILLFYDASDLFQVREREGLLYHMKVQKDMLEANRIPFGAFARQLYENGYAWDFVSDKMIDENLRVRRGRLLADAGTEYETILVPKCKLMLPQTFANLVSLAEKGAKILFVDSLPEDVPGLSRLEAGRKRMASLKSSLKFAVQGNLDIARCGKGLVMVSADVDAMLKEAGVTRESMYDQGLECIRRIKDDGGKYYFVRNSGSATVEGWIPLDTECGTAGIYNPMTERFGYAGIRTAADGKSEVYIKISPDQSFLIETFSGEYSGEPYRFYEPDGTPEILDALWTLTFTKGGPTLPVSRTVASLGSWTEYGPDCERFTGTAEYVTELRPHTGAEMYRLDLGDVCESAAVYIDDEYMGTVFKKPYSVEIPSSVASRGGALKVIVSNSMANRISWMDREGIPWKIFYNTNFPARSRKNRGDDGYFSAAGWDVQPSGLLGPVTITALK